MSLTSAEIEKIAKLSKLHLEENERELMREQMSSILTYVGKLEEVNVDGVEPMSHNIPVVNVFREDEPEQCEEKVRESIIDAFPEKEENMLKVKAIFE
jgi:aspartyl-tRNA(Asn)/glutamyl-tRNA(Gln) amidotransferase subunit C